MNMLSAAGICLLLAMAASMLRREQPTFALALSIGGGAVLLLLCALNFFEIADTAEQLAAKAGIDTEMLHLLLKVLGICYVVEFACGCCRDAGETSLADRLELLGKVTVLIMSLPLFRSVVDTVLSLI